jgi:N-acetylmuramoyl-L-alanine amidase
MRPSFRSLLDCASLMMMLLVALSHPAGAVDAIDVWIDPGHGGSAPGASAADGLPEHREAMLALQQSLALKGALQGLAYNTETTRSSDIDVSFSRRSRIASGLAANEFNFTATCQVFIIIHMNAVVDASARGTESYYSPTKPRLRTKDAYRADSSFAATVHPRLMANAAAVFLGCNSNRGVKVAGHFVSKWASVPTAYIEVCFISNTCQLGQIVQGSKQGVIASGIAAGVSFYIQPLGANALHSEATLAASDGITNSPATEIGPERPTVMPASVLATSEGFEDAAFPPSGWTLTTLGAPVPHRWFRSTDPLFVGAGSAGALVRGQSPEAVDEWLISPSVSMSSSEHSLRFIWAGNQFFASATNATCAVQPVGSSTWTTVWSLLDEPPGREWEFRERVIDLSAWIGDSVRVAFRVSGTNGADFMIDDVAFGSFPPTAVPSNDLCANALPLPAGSGSLNGTTCYAANYMSPPIGGSCVEDDFTGADVFFQFSAQAGDTLDASVTGSWFPVAYLVASCDSAVTTCLASTPSLGEADQFTGSFSHVFATTGTYYLVVDGVAGECGDFTLATALRGSTTGVDLGDLGSTPLSLASSPNPALGAVLFSGRLPTAILSPATLTVHDAAGRLLVTLDVVPSLGHFQISWDGRAATGARLPAGVYFARLSAGGESVARAVVLTR